MVDIGERNVFSPTKLKVMKMSMIRKAAETIKANMEACKFITEGKYEIVFDGKFYCVNRMKDGHTTVWAPSEQEAIAFAKAFTKSGSDSFGKN